jgi:hypothetical protein
VVSTTPHAGAGRLRRLLLWPLWWLCGWHKGERAVEWGEDGLYPYCPKCGRMLWTKDCPRCGQSYLDWTARGWDDIGAPVAMNMSGHVMCLRCVIHTDREEETEEWDTEEWDDEDECS